uniref:Uncharacterized protein n=1 Tax=Opuntia streptacantha TaxID=393608 RepID=A0A7C9DAF6_OPUST
MRQHLCKLSFPQIYPKHSPRLHQPVLFLLPLSSLDLPLQSLHQHTSPESENICPTMRQALHRFPTFCLQHPHHVPKTHPHRWQENPECAHQRIHQRTSAICQSQQHIDLPSFCNSDPIQASFSQQH